MKEPIAKNQQVIVYKRPGDSHYEPEFEIFDLDGNLIGISPRAYNGKIEQLEYLLKEAHEREEKRKQDAVYDRPQMLRAADNTGELEVLRKMLKAHEERVNAMQPFLDTIVQFAKTGYRLKSRHTIKAKDMYKQAIKFFTAKR